MHVRAVRIEAVGEGSGQHGAVRTMTHSVDTTGLLGSSKVDGEQVARGFPAWLTLPSGQDLATGRRWHFFSRGHSS